MERYKQIESDKIPDGWQKLKLGDLLDISSSKRIFFSEYVSDGVPFYRSKEIIEKFNNQAVSTELFISKERFDEIKRKYGVPQKGDILLTSVGTLGIPYLIENEDEFYFKDGNLTWFRKIDQDSILSQFLYYWFISKRGIRKLLDSSIGSTQQALTIDGLKNIEIDLPPTDAQRTIAKILFDLDEKIKLNRQMNKTLESIAQAIFNRWFVDNVDSMWPKGKLGDICEKITKGTTPTTLKKSFVETGINFIKVESIDDFGNFLTDKFAHIDSDTNLLLSRSIIQENDILYTIAGTIGRTAVASFKVLPANTNQAVAIIRLRNKPLYLSYIRLLLKTSSLSDKFQSKVVHAVQPNLSLGEISETEILMPDERILIEFNKITDSIFSKIEQNAVQISILSQIRDSLLPRLISGKISVAHS